MLLVLKYLHLKNKFKKNIFRTLKILCKVSPTKLNSNYIFESYTQKRDNPIWSYNSKTEIQSHKINQTHYLTVRTLLSEYLPLECPFSAQPISDKTCTLLLNIIVMCKGNRKLPQLFLYNYIYIHISQKLYHTYLRSILIHTLIILHVQKP